MSSSDDQHTTTSATTDDKTAPNQHNGPHKAFPLPNGRGSILAFQTSKDMNRLAKKYRTEIAASSSSILSTFFTFPLDFAKSRMQSYNTSFGATIVDAYRAEGLRAFWRGVFPPLISITMVRTISFSLYQKSKYAYDHAIYRVTGQSPLMNANAPGSWPSWDTAICFGAAGATAGAIITSLSCPFELTKLNEQLAGKMARDAAEAANKGQGAQAAKSAVAADVKSKGPFPSSKFAYNLVKERGIQGLYAGFRLHLFRDTLGTCLYFMTYESTKQLMGNARGKSATSPYAVAMAGGLCGIVSWMIIYPIDVAKTLFQKSVLSNPPGMAVKQKIKWFGKGQYRGLGVSVIRSCIINMIFFSNFEWMKKQINALEV